MGTNLASTRLNCSKIQRNSSRSSGAITAPIIFYHYLSLLSLLLSVVLCVSYYCYSIFLLSLWDNRHHTKVDSWRDFQRNPRQDLNDRKQGSWREPRWEPRRDHRRDPERISGTILNRIPSTTQGENLGTIPGAIRGGIHNTISSRIPARSLTGFLSEFLAQWWPGYQLDSGGIPLVLTYWQMLLPVFRKRVSISFKLKMRCFPPEDTTPRLKMNKCKA